MPERDDAPRSVQGAPRAEDLFFAAMALPARERTEWLKVACGADDELHHEVSSLVSAAERASGGTDFLETPAAEVHDPGKVAARALIGATIDDYTIVDVLGEGGMGVVYRAEQAHPKRAVALKLVRPGLTSRTMLKRFEIEADALGRLRHPGIAAIYAAGTADLGAGPQPYFAMELVEGLLLKVYLARREPPPRECARIVAMVADAVQHAHQQGVIHRDLKPDNIIIEEDIDGAPRPRVLDFGVARLMHDEGERGQRTAATEAGHVVGTLQYMSPEQVQGGAVDTRSDVYALGLIAWEMLAGKPARSFGEGSLADVVSNILERDPPPVRSVRRDVPQDLSLIVGKALLREPSRRYAAAGELSADLDRFLQAKPVTARAPTALYLATRFARRHPVLSVSVLLATLVVVVSVAGIWNRYQMQIKHSRELSDANQKLQAANDALLATNQKLTAANIEGTQRLADSKEVKDFVFRLLKLDVNAPDSDRDAVVLMWKRLEAQLDEPIGDRARIDLLNAVAERYIVDANYEHAREIYQRSLALCDADLPKSHELRGAALHGLAASEYFLSQRDSEILRLALSHYEEALAIRIATLGSENAETALTMRHLAASHRYAGQLADKRAREETNERAIKTWGAERDAQYETAERLYTQSLEIHERLHAKGDALADAAMVASGYNGLGAMLAQRGQHADAEKHYRRALELMRTLPDSQRRVVDEARVLRNVAFMGKLLGHYDDSNAALLEAQEIFSRQLSPNHREVATTLIQRARLERDLGSKAVARELAQKVISDFQLPDNDQLRDEARRIAEMP